MKFYKENGINPLGGCLPLVAQLPVFWALFNVLRAISDWQPGTTPQKARQYPAMIVLLDMTPSVRNAGFSWRIPVVSFGFASRPLLGERLGKRDAKETQRP